MNTEHGTQPAKLNPSIVGDMVVFDRDECVELGLGLHSQYVENNPFPHIALDNFLPVDCLRRVVDEFPERETGRFSDAHSKLKTGYQMEKIESAFITNLLNALNSSQFLQFLENMTGIKGLIPDPHFLGGGLHETARGGHLSIHADFNIHSKLKLTRRMNLILFLNENWQSDWGGALELWEKDMSRCAESVQPMMANAVIFNTESDSFHGHPDPTNNPEDRFRRSIALYYYTAIDEHTDQPARTTDFRRRPGTSDARQPLGVRMKEIARDLVPPLIMRKLMR